MPYELSPYTASESNQFSMKFRLFLVTSASLGPTRLDLGVCLNWVMTGGIMASVSSNLAQTKVRNVGRIGVPTGQNHHTYRRPEQSMSVYRILCFKQRRKVTTDNTMKSNRRVLQLLSGSSVLHASRCKWKSKRTWRVGFWSSTKDRSSLHKKLCRAMVC